MDDVPKLVALQKTNTNSAVFLCILFLNAYYHYTVENVSFRITPPVIKRND